MKNLIGVLVMMMIAIGANGQGEPIVGTGILEAEGSGEKEVINVKGVGPMEVGGFYTTFSFNNTSIEAFREVIDTALKVLTANGVKFKDQLSNESDFKFKNISKLTSTYDRVIKGETVMISWVISTNDGIAVLAFLILKPTTFDFEVDPRYM